MPWVVAGAGILGVPTMAIAIGSVEGPDLYTLAAGTVLAWLLMTEMAGQKRTLAVFLPPLAWARLLAARAALSERRQACARAAVLPGSTLMVGAVPQAFTNAEEALAWALGGLVAVLVAVGAFRVSGSTGVLLRLLAVPLWLAGTAALLVLGLLALLPALIAGRAVRLIKGGGTLLASAVELASGPEAEFHS